MPRYNRLGEVSGFNPGMEEIERKYFWPFFHDKTKTWMILMKVLFGIFLVPTRLVLILVTFMIFYVVLRILSIGRKPESHPKGLRKFLLNCAAKTTARVLLFISGVYWIRYEGRPTILPLYKLSEMRKKRQNKRKGVEANGKAASEEATASESSDGKRTRTTRSMLRKLNPAYIFNHKSPLDIPLSVVAGGGTFVSKVEVAKIPFMGIIARSYEMVMVDRKDSKSREKTAREIENVMRDRGRFPLIVYPEGVTTNGSCLVNFRPGVFRPGKPIQPAILNYWAPFGESAWDVQQGVPFLLDLLSRPFIIARVKYLPLYEPTTSEKSDAILFANNVRNMMAAAMKVPTYDMCYKDKIAFEDYCHNRLTFDQCLEKLCEEYRNEIGAEINKKK